MGVLRGVGICKEFTKGNQNIYCDSYYMCEDRSEYSKAGAGIGMDVLYRDLSFIDFFVFQ